MSRSVRLAATLTVASATASGEALACPVCFTAKAETLWAYYGTALLLTLLPFALFGALALWLYRRS